MAEMLFLDSLAAAFERRLAPGEARGVTNDVGRAARVFVVAGPDPLGRRGNVEAGRDFARSKSYENAATTGRVAYVIDDFDERLVPRRIEIHGRGELRAMGGRAIDPGFDDELLRIHPEHVAQWGLPANPE